MTNNWEGHGNAREQDAHDEARRQFGMWLTENDFKKEQWRAAKARRDGAIVDLGGGRGTRRLNRDERAFVYAAPAFVADAQPHERDWVTWALTQYPDKFTPAQHQALRAIYVLGVSQRAAARVVGVSQSAFRARRVAADAALKDVLYAAWGIGDKRPSEVRRGRNAGRAVVTEVALSGSRFTTGGEAVGRLRTRRTTEQEPMLPQDDKEPLRVRHCPMESCGRARIIADDSRFIAAAREHLRSAHGLDEALQRQRTSDLLDFPTP